MYNEQRCVDPAVDQRAGPEPVKAPRSRSRSERSASSTWAAQQQHPRLRGDGRSARRRREPRLRHALIAGEKETARRGHVVTLSGPPRARSFRPSLRGAEGALVVGSLDVGPLVRGPGRAAERDALTSRRAATTVRSVQAHSLRPLSRMRAITFMHVCLPPPDVPAPAGPADQAAASRGRSVWGSRCACFGKGDPGFCRACGGDPRRTNPGRRVPARRCPASVTLPSDCNRAPPRMSLRRIGRRRTSRRATGRALPHARRSSHAGGKRGRVIHARQQVCAYLVRERERVIQCAAASPRAPRPRGRRARARRPWYFRGREIRC